MEQDRFNLFLDLAHSPHVVTVFLFLLAILAFSHIAAFIAGKLTPRRSVTEIKIRIVSWWKIFVLVFATISFGKLGAAILFAGVSIAALREYLKVVKLHQATSSVVVLCFAAVPCQYALAYIDAYSLFLVFIPLGLNVLLALTFITRQQTSGFVRTLGLVQWGALLSIFTLSHIVYFMNLDDPITVEVEPLGLITFVIVMTELNDAMQYLTGKAIGRHKILPLISPNKTVEGMLGGVVSCAGVAYFLGPYITPLTASISTLFGVLLALCGFFGDAFMSAIKRDMQVKDFGMVLPGHGGVLDRVDSLTIAAPFFFHTYRFFLSGLN